MIDARKHHDPAKVPGLIALASERAGSQKELAERLGITPRYLQLLSRGQKEASYVMQVAIERVASNA